MRGFEVRQVYHHVLRSVAQGDPEGKFIRVRWVDVNKGTREVPKVRIRLVGQEFVHEERRDDLYAPTPPLAAARFLLSTCASRGKRGPGDYHILFLDLELPAEDPMSEGGTRVGKLDKAMYGTRDAPTEWQAKLERTMIKLGFRPVVSTSCLYYHSSLDVLVLMSIYDVTSIFLGPGHGDEQEGKFLGRSIC